MLCLEKAAAAAAAALDCSIEFLGHSAAGEIEDGRAAVTINLREFRVEQMRNEIVTQIGWYMRPTQSELTVISWGMVHGYCGTAQSSRVQPLTVVSNP